MLLSTLKFRWLVVLCSLLACLQSEAWAVTPLQLGIAPHTSARVILEMYQPLRLHLEKALAMPVEVVTAPDFTEFAKRMLHQDYDIAVTTGHQARLAQTDAKYSPLLTYAAEFRALAVVLDDGPIKQVSDLTGQAVLGLSPTSLVTQWGQHWLKENGLSQAMRYVSASDSVFNLVLDGQAAVGFTSMANFQNLPRESQLKLRFLAASEPMPGRVYMLNSRQLSRKAEIDAALIGFAATVEGKAYFAKYKLDGYRQLKPKELETMDPYAAEVRQSLK